MKPLKTIRQSDRFKDLYVHKYTRNVFFKNLWDEDLIELRGKVCLEDGTVVINPFTKVFNRHENGTDIDLDEPCLVVGKVNGFMAAATYVDAVKEVVVSTTGSLDSDYVTLAEKYINAAVRGEIQKQWKGYTLLFEVCDPEDPHIVPEKPGLYLIGIRAVKCTDKYFSTPYKEETLDNIAKTLGVMRPKWEIAIFRDILRANKETNREGVMVYGQYSHTVLKLKSPYYIALKAAARIKDISKLDKARVDEEFYPLIDHIKKHAKNFTSLPEQERLEYMRGYYKLFYREDG